MNSRSRQRGNALIEMTLVGIPLIFLMISIFEMARGMWLYVTLAHAVREGTRYMIVHGKSCASTPNVCTITVANIVARIRLAGAGLDPTQLNITLQTASLNTVTSTIGPGTAQTLAGNNAVFPGGITSAPGNDVTVRATYPFRSAIAMFWPGAGPAFGFGQFTLRAAARDTIQF